MLTLSDALTELMSRPPRSAFARRLGSETGARIVWDGTRFEMENFRGGWTTWYLSADDVLGEWVVLDAPCLPEFVAGGPDIPHFPGSFMLPVVSRLLDDADGNATILLAEPEHGSFGPVTSMCSRVGWTCPKVMASIATAIRWAGSGKFDSFLVVDAETWAASTLKQEALKAFKRVLVVRPQP